MLQYPVSKALHVDNRNRRTQAVYTDSLALREMHHFALEGEVVALLCTA